MKIRILFFSLIVSNATFAQLQSHEIGIGYTFASPIATMKQNISHGDGITMDYYFIPEKISRLAIGLDMNYTIYGYDKSKQEYTFEDGTTARMDIVVDNSFFNLMVGGRYFLTSVQEKIIKPYVALKGGYSWFGTHLNIYDPDDKDHCEPLETDILLKDGTFSFSVGGGLQWDFGNLINKESHNRFLFNVGANLTLGNKINYMNTDAPTHNHANHPSDVNGQFINTQTQIVHEHHVGYVYTSYLEMVEIRGGFIFRR